MAQNEKIVSNKGPKPLGAYPHARKVGNLLFLSGLGPQDPETNQVPGLTRNDDGQYTRFDFEAQCHSVFRNIRNVLEASGSKWEDLVDVTVFLANLERDFPLYNKIYAEYFSEVAPCRTTVGVSDLPGPISIEVKCIAVLE